jgi:hypothetical protein
MPQPKRDVASGALFLLSEAIAQEGFFASGAVEYPSVGVGASGELVIGGLFMTRHQQRQPAVSRKPGIAFFFAVSVFSIHIQMAVGHVVQATLCGGSVCPRGSLV